MWEESWPTQALHFFFFSEYSVETVGNKKTITSEHLACSAVYTAMNNCQVRDLQKDLVPMTPSLSEREMKRGPHYK